MIVGGEALMDIAIPRTSMMTLQHRPLAMLAFLVVSMHGPVPVHAAPRPATKGTPQLQNAAPSMDALIARFLGALNKKDQKTLRQLRVDEREYIHVIMPGSIEPGKERREFPEEKAKYFWDVLNTKSSYSETALLNGYGGRKYRVRDVSWAKGVTH